MKGYINTFASIAALFICALMFTSSGSANTAPTFEEQSFIEKQTTDASAATAAVVVKAIVEEAGICNVADRATETVERKFTAEVVRIPEAPTFAIDHVPIS